MAQNRCFPSNTVGVDDVPTEPGLVFDLPARLSAKADPALIADDARHLRAIAEGLGRAIAEVSDRLAAARLAPGGGGQAAMDRDFEIHRLTARLRTLRRFGLDLCLGRMVLDDAEHPVYVGRLGLTDPSGERLLVDWRSPAAEPFFGATHANPMGLVSRRRYHWTHGRITDYWDEVFAPEGLEGHAALDDQSAFIASLGASRTPRMRDVLATIQSDQDAIIRAGSRGALVVDGGPGTGKTVAALHRAAYLVYSEPHLERHRGGVLVVGPHEKYLDYVADVLPRLGEDGVQMCTVRDLVPEAAAAPLEGDPHVARLKSSVAMVRAVEPAVRFYEEPPTAGMLVEANGAELWLSPADWAEAFDSAEPGTPHNEARDQVWEALVEILVDKLDEDEVSPDAFRRTLGQDEELTDVFEGAWPLVEATDLVADLWSVPAYLRRCAPWLEPDEARALQRPESSAWTAADIPILDAARARLGDARASGRRRRRAAAEADQREYMSRVVDDMIAADVDREGKVWMLVNEQGLESALVDTTVLEADEVDPFAGPFAHIVVDEAQELTDAQWQMLVRRCPSRSFTVVGDRAQARDGFTETWQERLERIGLTDVTVATLTINYRTPREVMAVAKPAIRAALPGANVPTSVRTGGAPVRYGTLAELGAIVEEWLAAHDDGVACVIGDVAFEASDRVSSLTPETAKGLEFDLVVLIDPESWGTGTTAAVDRYVAMTRATQQLVILAGKAVETDSD